MWAHRTSCTSLRSAYPFDKVCCFPDIHVGALCLGVLRCLRRYRVVMRNPRISLSAHFASVALHELLYASFSTFVCRDLHPLVATFLLLGLTWAHGLDCRGLRCRCGGSFSGLLFVATGPPGLPLRVHRFTFLQLLTGPARLSSGSVVLHLSPPVFVRVSPSPLGL